MKGKIMKIAIILAAACLALCGCKTTTVTNGKWKVSDRRIMTKTEFKGKYTVDTNGTLTVEANVNSGPDTTAVSDAAKKLNDAAQVLQTLVK